MTIILITMVTLQIATVLWLLLIGKALSAALEALSDIHEKQSRM